MPGVFSMRTRTPCPRRTNQSSLSNGIYEGEWGLLPVSSRCLLPIDRCKSPSLA